MMLSEQEDYLWAMRDAACDFSKDNHTEMVAPEAVQSRIMASLVPDEVIHDLNNSIPNSDEAFLMYAEINGLTELCELYNVNGMGGPSKATEVLNQFFGGIVHQIILHGGDVVEFSRDAILAIWKPTLFGSMCAIAHKPINCALAIQKFYSSYKTDIDVILEVKLIITAGTIELLEIGDTHTAHNIIYGEPLDEIKIPGLDYKAGDIVVSSCIWTHTFRSYYGTTDLIDGQYQKITHKIGNQEQEEQQEQSTPIKLYDDYLLGVSSSTHESSLRPSVNIAIRRKLYQYLEKFVITPLKHCIKMNQPLEELSEMRQVVAVSINIVYMDPEPSAVYKLINNAYKSVCYIVEEVGGCIQDVQLFNGEFRFLVIFGLRGLKVESECRMALKCAAQCKRQIHNFYSVSHVSVGITTGRIYCGLCGHHLRKQYIVAGSIINEATRYSTNHKNKIICDNKTFLNSRLGAKNFILQNMKSNIPFYEYCDEMKSPHGELEPVSEFPLLGNYDKLELYRQLLRNYLESPKNEQISKMLVIQGMARQGKTRLLHEFTCETPTEIPVCTINLSENDKQIPFETLRQIFWYKFGIHPFIDPSSTMYDFKLTEPFDNYLTPYLYGFVNGIWNTYFDDEGCCRSITSDQRHLIERVFMRRICLKYFFKSVYIVVIDNFENVDNESLQYLDILLDSSNIFLLTSIGYGKWMNPRIEALLMDQRVEVARLRPIDHWFHAALACQFLNVYAIPRELESVIKSKSNGHPGWIENVLFSMLKTESIVIEHMNVNEIADAQLICPPRQIIESYKLSSIREKDEPTRIVPVCLLQSGGNIYNIRAELSMDTAVFKTLDSLLFHDKLVIRCGAALGDQFSRDMLLYVLPPCSPREFASETCQDLPNFASCGYMQFCNTYVREFIYQSLVDDEQKKEFHLRAMKYLEEQRQKCRTCDYGPLHLILDTTAEQVLHDSMEGSISQPTTTTTTTLLPSTSKQYDLSTVAVPVPAVQPSDINNFDNREGTEDFKSIWGFRCISKLKDCGDSLIRSDFSTENCHDCQCLPILTSAYSQLTGYYKSVGRHIVKSSKVIDIMLQYANILIRSSNLPLALTVLDNALDVLETTTHQADIIIPWQTELVRGKIHTLIGYAHMELDQFEEAELHLQSALKQYHYEFPLDRKLTSKLKASRLSLKQSFGLFVLPNTLTKKNMSYWESYICNNVSEVLSHLATLFMMMSKWDYAELAATSCLSKALKANDDFATLCTAYSNMLKIAVHCKRDKLSAAIEVYALRLCNMKTESMTQKELKAVTELYISIFWYALSYADIEKAKQIGDIALRTAKSIKALELVVPILPTLMYTNLFTKQVNAAVQILNELNSYANNSNDQSSRLWYVALCMTFQLETGNVITPYDECEKFIEGMTQEDFINIKDKEARNHYCVNMWLSCVRNRMWDKATFWYATIKELNQLENNDCFVNQFTGLYLLEGLITTLFYKTDENNRQGCRYIQKEVEKIMKSLKESVKNMEIILPRFLHMKAYDRIVRYNDANKAFKYLGKGEKLAVKYNNMLEEEWIMHSLKAWNKSMDRTDLNNVQEHVEHHEILECNERIFEFFTLLCHPTHVGNKVGCFRAT